MRKIIKIIIIKINKKWRIGHAKLPFKIGRGEKYFFLEKTKSFPLPSFVHLLVHRLKDESIGSSYGLGYMVGIHQKSCSPNWK
jgi:hypothetical protein